MKSEPTKLKNLFDWASPRLEVFAKNSFSWDPERTCDPATLKDLLLKASIPVWPWLLDFESRFGGLRHQWLRFGLYDWLYPRGENRRQPSCTAGAKTRLEHPDKRIKNEWLVLVCDQDLDNGIYGNEAGVLYLVRPPFSPPIPWSMDGEHFFEHFALDYELKERRRASKTNFWLEIDGEIGLALSKEFSLPLIAEASDDVTRFWWDGELCVREAASLVDPVVRATRVECTDLDRLLKVAKNTYRLANKGRKRPLQPRIPPTTPERKLRIFIVSSESYDFARRLGKLRRVGVELVSSW